MTVVSDQNRRDWGALAHLEQAEHSVYAIHHTLTNTCVYVGMTCDLRRRLREHGRTRGWRQPKFYVTSTQVVGRAEAERVELAWMRRHHPTANRYPLAVNA